MKQLIRLHLARNYSNNGGLFQPQSRAHLSQTVSTCNFLHSVSSSQPWQNPTNKHGARQLLDSPDVPQSTNSQPPGSPHLYPLLSSLFRQITTQPRYFLNSKDVCIHHTSILTQTQTHHTQLTSLDPPSPLSSPDISQRQPPNCLMAGGRPIIHISPHLTSGGLS